MSIRCSLSCQYSCFSYANIHVLVRLLCLLLRRLASSSAPPALTTAPGTVGTRNFPVACYHILEVDSSVPIPVKLRIIYFPWMEVYIQVTHENGRYEFLQTCVLYNSRGDNGMRATPTEQAAVFTGELFSFFFSHKKAFTERKIFVVTSLSFDLEIRFTSHTSHATDIDRVTHHPHTHTH